MKIRNQLWAGALAFTLASTACVEPPVAPVADTSFPVVDIGDPDGNDDAAELPNGSDAIDATGALDVRGTPDAEPDIAEPDAAEPDTIEFDAADPDGAEPDAIEFDGAEPDADAELMDDIADDIAEEDMPEVPEVCVPFGDACEGLGPIPKFDKWAITYPIVLAHGAAGFESVGSVGYFWGVADLLRDKNYPTFVAELDPFNSSDIRGPQLAEFVDRVQACTCAPKVNIIAHSMGGNDARYIISSMGYGDRVGALMTIATPHYGTPLADVVTGVVPGLTDPIVDFVLWFAGDLYADPLEHPDFRAQMEQMSTANSEIFNDENPDDPNVSYYSWGGRGGLIASGFPECWGADVPSPFAHQPVSTVLWATWTLLGGSLGTANDGIVPVWSSKWGHFRGCVMADHMAECGHIFGFTGFFDYKKFYLDEAKYLAKKGF